MSHTTFACTVLHTNEGTYKVGEVVRRKGTKDAWSDTIILGFSDPERHGGSVYVRMARLYAYANCVGTTSPGVLMSAEEYTISANDLMAFERCAGSPMISGSVGHERPGQYESEVIDLRTKAA
jgi:hypothetical protein